MSENEKVPWHDEYKIGIKNIDNQHHKLFDLVNKLYSINDDDVNAKESLRYVLYEFSEYMKIHFKDEEEYMLSIAYPGLDEHKKIHQHIVGSLAKVISTPAKLSIIKSKMRVVAKRVLIDHILNEDIKIKLFLLAQDDEDIFNLDSL